MPDLTRETLEELWLLKSAAQAELARVWCERAGCSWRQQQERRRG